MNCRKLKTISNLFIKIFENADLQGSEDFDFIFEELGFQDRSSSGVTYIHRKDKYVVKLPFFVGDTPKKAIPTVHIKNNKFCGDLVLQPLAKPISLKKYNELTDKYGGAYEPKFLNDYGQDAHENNLGIYKNKIVSFDW